MGVLGLAKTVIGFVVSLGVGNIVGNAIKFTTPTTLRFLEKICIGAGTLVLCGVASDVALQYTESKIDQVSELATKLISEEEVEECTSSSESS